MIISSKKYACETCIKGHRSSSCKHTDRPLFEIKKKGRPVTQCEHCRELRKSKQIHIKCVCENKELSSQGSKQGFERAAFPNGLPEALEALVAFQSQGEGSSSDSDHGDVVHTHKCKPGEPCDCVTLRTKKNKRTSVVPTHDQRRGPAASGSGSRAAFTNDVIMGRIAELRPVLPRPSSSATPFGGTNQRTSAGSISHPGRHHKAGQAPYELAYGMTHQQPLHHQSYMDSTATFAYPFNEQPHTAHQISQMGNHPSPNFWAQGNVGPSRNRDFLSVCGCGDDCICPGCLHHNRAASTPSSSAYASCANPGGCGTCLDCTILSLPSSAFEPLDTALSIPSVTGQAPHHGSEPVAEWLRQISMSAGNFSSPSSTSFSSQQLPLSNFSRQQQHQDWPPPHSREPRGPSGHNSRYDFAFDAHDMNNLGFPLPSIQGHGHHHRSTLSMSMGSAMHVDGTPMIDPRLLHPTMGGHHDQYLSFPSSDSSRSRSPSASSQSSHPGSESSSAHGHPHHPRPIPGIGPSGRVQGIFPNTQSTRSAPQLIVTTVGNLGSSTAVRPTGEHSSESAPRTSTSTSTSTSNTTPSSKRLPT